jgi:Cellulase (glycosyl hydrolase family 5)
MRWFALSLVCAVVVGVVATAATARTSIISVQTPETNPLATAIDDSIFESSQAPTAFAMASQAGTSYVRLIIPWHSIAPVNLPSSWDPTDPNSPYYRWSSLDAAVAAAQAHGVQLILDIFAPPNWGYSVKPDPKKFNGGTPNITDLGQFATAIATRYKGVVHAYSVWNEPNFNRNLYPQSESNYRGMVNAVADSVHAVDPSALVLAGELAPFKHAKTKTDPNSVVPPITWMQQMLCVSSTKPYHLTCPAGSAHFDVWAHHPYSDTGPYGHARVAGGVELGDLPKMESLLQTAWGLGAITTANTPSNQPFPFWVTEIGWTSNPPNKHGVPMTLETRWTAESFYQLWKSGATVGTWYLLQDEPANTPFQSGLYLASQSLSKAVAKPLLTPFEFPFVAYLHSGGKVMVWGRDTTSTTQPVEIDMKVGAHWKQVATVTSNNYGIFQATLGVHAMSKYSMRAKAPDSGTSATFSLRIPTNENMNVTPFPAG